MITLVLRSQSQPINPERFNQGSSLKRVRSFCFSREVGGRSASAEADEGFPSFTPSCFVLVQPPGGALPPPFQPFVSAFFWVFSVWYLKLHWCNTWLPLLSGGASFSGLSPILEKPLTWAAVPAVFAEVASNMYMCTYIYVYIYTDRQWLGFPPPSVCIVLCCSPVFL